MGSSETLRSVIDAGRSSKRLDELSSARVIGKIALQVHAAEQKAGAGKAVGPVTPGQITLLPSGEAKFETGGATGSTLGYSAPEQIAGGPGDRRSDVFSVGTVLWEALTHQRLFDAMNDAAVKAAVQEREITAPVDINANIPAELSAICMRALARNPSDRYQSLKSMAVEIEEFLEEAGYADDDTRIAQYLVAMAAPQVAKRPAISFGTPSPAGPGTQPGSGPIPAKAPSSTQPPPATLRPPTAPTQAEPSILTETAAEPRAKRGSGADLATALANAGKPISSVGTAIGIPAAPAPEDWQDKAAPLHAPIPSVAPAVPLSGTPATTPTSQQLPITPSAFATIRPDSDKATIASAVPPQVKVATAIEAKHAEAKQPAVLVEDVPKPAAQIVEEPKSDPRQTLIGASFLQPRTPAGDAKADLYATIVDRKPAGALVEPKPVEPPVETKADANPDDSRTTLVDTKPPEAVAAARAPSQSEAAPAAAAREQSKPNPVDAVSLPGRDSKGDLLAGWGWGTDKHDAIAPAGYADDSDDLYEQPNPRKPLLYAIGGGLAVALLITIVAFAAGGSKENKKPANAKAAAADRAKAEVAPPTAPATEPSPPAAGSDLASADPAIDEAAKAQAAAAEAAQAEAAKAEAAKQEVAAAQAAKDEAARLAAEAKQARLAQAQADKAEAARLKAEAKTARAEAAKAEAANAQLARTAAAKAKAEARAKARAEADARAKTAKTAKTVPKAKPAPKRADKTSKAEPKTVAKAEPTGKLDVETAYRIGLQQFARGDTSGALASLRTSLAGNPNYAPTWRGLGLVFEKMGERDQARAAYKRYLQLAPSAGDAEIIRGRLERLGT